MLSQTADVSIYIINTARLLKLEYEKGKNNADTTDAITNINTDNIMTALPIDIASNLYINMLSYTLRRFLS
ncbi:MAG TPA: hypothetical protein VFJ51_14895 [Nitrososphaeraceae archaeon]|nr:hypothetical protein [Nitrososphaeraceae archaeon]